MDNDDRDKIIVDIDNIDIITNGKLEDMAKVTDPNQIGRVLFKDTQEFISNITPMIMIINQGMNDYRGRLNYLIQNGGDMDKSIEYYGRNTTPRELADNYRNY
jgi:hypothetical protein